jgi:hypothetical protein
MQLIVGSLMLYVSLNVERLMDNVIWPDPFLFQIHSPYTSLQTM